MYNERWQLEAQRALFIILYPVILTARLVECCISILAKLTDFIGFSGKR